jgi:hypothetical protein
MDGHRGLARAGRAENDVVSERIEGDHLALRTDGLREWHLNDLS